MLPYVLPFVLGSVIIVPAPATLSVTVAATKIDSSVRPAAASLTVTTAAPKIDSTVRPGRTTAVINTAAPTITIGISGNAVLPYVLPFTLGSPAVTVTPDAAALSATGVAPKIDSIIRPDAAQLTATTSDPTVSIQTWIQPEAAAFTITAAAPLVDSSVVVTPDGAALTVAAAAPNVDTIIRPDSAVLTATTAAPTVAGLTAGTNSLPYVLPFTLGDVYAPSQAVLSITAATPTLHAGLRPSTAALAVTTAAPTVAASIVVTPTGAQLSITAAEPIVSPIYVTPSAAALTIVCAAPAVTGLAGVYTPAGAWSTSRVAAAPVAGPGWWTERPAPNPVAGAGWFNRPGAQPAGVRGEVQITAETSATVAGQFRVGAQLAVTAASRFEIDGGVPPGFPYTFPYTFFPADRVLRPAPAQLVITTITPNVVLPKLVEPGAAELAVTGASPVVSTPTVVSVSAASLALTGAAPTVLNPCYIIPAGTSLAVTMQAPTIVIAGGVDIDSFGAGNYAASGTTNWTHVIGANAKALVVVFCWSRSSGSGAFTTNTRTVRVGSTNLTFLVAYANNNGAPPNAVTEFYYMLNPPTGSQTITVTVSGKSGYNMAKGQSAAFVRATAVVDGGGAAGAGTGTALSQSVNSAVGHRILQAFCHQSATAITNYSQRADYTQNTTAGVVLGDAAGGDAAVTFTATRASGVAWARIAADIQN